MLISYLRTAVLYLVLIFAIRLMGKRQIGEMEASEFVVTMLVANLAAIPMQDGAIPLYSGLLPILVVLGMELVLSGLLLHSVVLRKLLCGKPVILIRDGKVDLPNLRRTRVTLDELCGHLREKSVLDIRTVQYAILETNGSLSVFPYPKFSPANAKDAGVKASPQSLPITLIEDGQLLKQNLILAGKQEDWVKKELEKQGLRQEDALYLSVDSQDQVILLRKECL